MKARKLISVFLSLLFLVGSLNIAYAADKPSVGYLLSGDVSGRNFTLKVSVQNVRAIGGRIAIAFDADKLELSDVSLANVVKPVSGVNITSEGLDDSVLVSNDRGHVMFAWYTSSNRGIDALSNSTEIAEVPFHLKDGVTADDFSRNTITLYYVNETMVDKWYCSAGINSAELTAYRNTSVKSAYVCGIDYAYPNCDYVPIVSYDVSVNVFGYNNKPISASVALDGLTAQTNSEGRAVFKMEGGVYAYRIDASGYETRSGYIIVNNSNVSVDLFLMSYAQIAATLAENLQIGYAKGDSSTSVTDNLILPMENDYGDITWNSSNSDVVDAYGVVKRTDDDERVVLTATVTAGGASETRSFDITVKGRLTAEEKNAAIVARDKEALEIIYAPGDRQNSVTMNLTLKQLGAEGCGITWSSDSPYIIDSDGTVVRPSGGSAQVKLTAYIKRGTVQDTKEFKVTVKGRGMSIGTRPTPMPTPTPTPTPTPIPSQTTEPDDVTEPTSAPTLPPAPTPIPSQTTEPDDVTEPTSAPTPPPTPTPIPTSEATPESVDDKPLTDSEIVARVVEALEIGYADFNSADGVTEAITLPQFGAEDSIIEWTSSNPAVVTAYGGVVRQAQDTTVTLTATIYKGSVTESKSFTIVVKAADTIPVNPNNGQETEIERANGTARRRREAVAAVDSEVSREGKDTAVQKGENITPAEQIDSNKTETKNDRFADISSVPWAREAILTLAERGVISGTSDTTYSPQDNIRRADFVILLMRMLGLGGDITDTFDDVTADKYYYNSVSLAKSLGIVAGIDDRHFNPESSISRQDMMVMTYRALEKLGMADMPAAELTSFKDADGVSDYAYESVSHLVGGGYINGDDKGNLNPKSNTTRAETAVFLYNIGK